MNKALGKIEAIRVGLGGYQDVMFGVTFTLRGEAWGVSDFKGFWSPSQMKRSEHAQWTEEGRKEQIAGAFYWLDQLMADAKVTDAGKLVGKPIEATFDGMQLKSWRLLTEVL